MIVHKIDIETGNWTRDVNVGNLSPVEAAALSPAYILAPIPDGMIPSHCRWDGEQWAEYITEEYSSDETPQPPTLEERLSALEQLEIERIMGGVD